MALSVVPAQRRRWSDKIILNSFSLAFDASFYPDAGQQQIDAAVADLNTLGTFTVNVCFQDAAAGLNSCGGLDVVPTPEPGTFGLIGLAFLALALAYRRCALAPKSANSQILAK